MNYLDEMIKQTRKQPDSSESSDTFTDSDSLSDSESYEDQDFNNTTSQIPIIIKSNTPDINIDDLLDQLATQYGIKNHNHPTPNPCGAVPPKSVPNVTPPTVVPTPVVPTQTTTQLDVDFLMNYMISNQKLNMDLTRILQELGSDVIVQLIEKCGSRLRLYDECRNRHWFNFFTLSKEQFNKVKQYLKLPVLVKQYPMPEDYYELVESEVDLQSLAKTQSLSVEFMKHRENIFPFNEYVKYHTITSPEYITYLMECGLLTNFEGLLKTHTLSPRMVERYMDTWDPITLLETQELNTYILETLVSKFMNHTDDELEQKYPNHSDMKTKFWSTLSYHQQLSKSQMENWKNYLKTENNALYQSKEDKVKEFTKHYFVINATTDPYIEAFKVVIKHDDNNYRSIYNKNYLYPVGQKEYRTVCNFNTKKSNGRGLSGWNYDQAVSYAKSHIQGGDQMYMMKMKISLKDAALIPDERGKIRCSKFENLGVQAL